MNISGNSANLSITSPQITSGESPDKLVKLHIDQYVIECCSACHASPSLQCCSSNKVCIHTATSPLRLRRSESLRHITGRTTPHIIPEMFTEFFHNCFFLKLFLIFIFSMFIYFYLPYFLLFMKCAHDTETWPLTRPSEHFR